MNNFNKVLTVILLFVAVMLFAQTPQTLPAGFSATQSVSDPSQCKAITGALYTLCPVVGGTQDGFYVMFGTAAPKKVAFIGDVTGGTTDYQLLTNKPTSLTCTTSSQSNTGLTASGCTFK